MPAGMWSGTNHRSLGGAVIEYEYAFRADGDDEPWSDYSDDPDFLTDGSIPYDSHIVRRVKAGPWERVFEDEND